ncbi:hypothetical protein NDU88_001614 [Pleurodeles waltl]|uniref:Reverse transcriptase domain-containing protein n=1 Tax=Pleurodeles waltl TaxID=8319 RepID=A0AAV7NJL7_PLEWA|nr:hypothetical protein NDU88_001614 [Pleurodeles waltl]
MDDVTLFCTDGKSVQSLLEACKDFGKASGVKINVDKSQAKLFGHWDLCNEPLPFPIEAGLVKILGIWFGGPGAAAKSWKERLAKVKQKLGFWNLRHLSIEGKALGLRNDTLPVLQYVTQAWPLLSNVARALNSMVFHFVWHSKMDRVKRTVMHKEHRKGGKAVPDIPTILRAFFVCGCVRITLTNENKDHSACRVFRFFLLPVRRRLGWDKWENATMFNWDLPWYYKEIEKFVVEFGLNCVTPRTIHRLIRSRDTTEPVSDLPPATATRVGQETENGPSKRNGGKDRLGLSKAARRGRRERSGEAREWGCWRSQRLGPETPAETPTPGTGLEGGSKAPECGGLKVRSQKQCRARRRYRLRQRGGREAKLIADPDAWGLGHPPRRPQRERDWRETRRPLSVSQRPAGEITKAGLGKVQIPAPAAGSKRGKIDLGPGTEEDPGTGE